MLLDKPINVKHNKTGNDYKVVGFAVNATNAQNGKIMVMYQEHTTNKNRHYVREFEEFVGKFTGMELGDIPHEVSKEWVTVK